MNAGTYFLLLIMVNLFNSIVTLVATGLRLNLVNSSSSIKAVSIPYSDGLSTAIAEPTRYQRGTNAVEKAYHPTTILHS
jgi:hypothetical protein